MKFDFMEIAVMGFTIMLTDEFLTPFMAQSELFRLGKFFLQGWILLAVDDMLTKKSTHPVPLTGDGK